MSSRRAWLGLSLLGGCGFRPVYGPSADEATLGSDGLSAELSSIRVANIPERFGQLLRRDLERRFDWQPGRQARYILNASVSFNVDSLGYRRDGTITRQRYTTTGNWALSTLSVPPERLAASAIPVRAIDDYNIPDLQFFAADSSREAMERRLAEANGEEIARQVVLALRRRAAA